MKHATVRDTDSNPYLQDLLNQRYGETVRRPDVIEDSLVAKILSHRSVRTFSSAPLPELTLETLVAAAQSAATSSNLQLWSVVAVDDRERRLALAEVAGGQGHVERSPLFLVWLADLHRTARLADAQGAGKDALAYIDSFLTAAVDATLAAQNAVLAAESLGLGTVYIGALRNRPTKVAEILELPPQTFALFGTCIGWPEVGVAGAIRPRLPQEVVLHRNTYRPISEQQPAFEGYDRAVMEFQKSNKSSRKGPWTETAVAHVASIDGLGGRHCLRQALDVMGFELR
jgi:nitroreductase